jgi:transposase InsO family protein
MKKHGLLLAKHNGRRRLPEHDGQVATLRSNLRWCSDVLEFTCWNDEAVRLAFALGGHDRGVIGWTATTAGNSGEMIQDLMIGCAESRFGTVKASHQVQWLSDNGAIYATARTLDTALSLLPATTFASARYPMRGQ